MKIPNIFIPEKNLDEQTESMKNPKEIVKIKELIDLVLYEGLCASMFGNYTMSSNSFDGLIIDGIWVEYGLPTVRFYRFKDANTLKHNMCLAELVLENLPIDPILNPFYMITRDDYAGVIYAPNKDEAKEITEHYIKRFGFEARELKPS